MLGFALFMLGWLAFSLRSGEVGTRYGVFARSRTPTAFWSVCALKLGFALLGAVLIVLGLRHK
jgi:hypothetical protein